MTSRPRTLPLRALAWATAPLVGWLVACGGGEFSSGGDAGAINGDASVDQTQPGQGGAAHEAGTPDGGGGSPGSGGAVSNGGAPGSGGAVSNGGATGAGGAVSNGGATGAGGAVSNGGAAGAGGAVSNGGAAGTGGVISNGGAAGAGGVMSNGGAAGTGGATQVQCYCPSDPPKCEMMTKCEGVCGSVSYPRAACDCSAVCDSLTQAQCNQESRCTWNIYGTSCYSINCSDNATCPAGCTQKSGMCNANVESVHWQLPTTPDQCSG